MRSILPLVILISILFRWLVSLWGYSGQGKPPMYGDYEAQRHWMEITTKLPIGDWYRQTYDNDLLYWGLDYPPLTAYVSWLFGKISEAMCPELVLLHSSRGYESNTTKIFMRITVLYGDMILYIPSVTAMLVSLMRRPSLLPGYYLLLLLLNPSLLLIDHGHFQYNSICIAFTLFAGIFILNNHDIIGSILFVFALNFKQMTLYYSLIFFCILLRKCWIRQTWIEKILKFLSIGLTVIGTFAFLWLPFCFYPGEDETCVSSLGHVLKRLFPFSRGIFEDKVANIWYSLSVVYDYRNLIDLETLKMWSGILTLLLISPTLLVMIRKRILPIRFLLGLMNSSLAFFLASFQVHEKSLLLALIPGAFLINLDPLLFSWFQIIGTFSMFPLLVKDGLRTPYFCILGTYISLLFGFFQVAGTGLTPKDPTIRLGRRIIITLSILGMIVLHLLEVFIAPPTRYPDLYPALFSLYSFLHLFIIYWIGIYYLYVWQERLGIVSPRPSQQLLNRIKESKTKLEMLHQSKRLHQNASYTSISQLHQSKDSIRSDELIPDVNEVSSMDEFDGGLNIDEQDGEIDGVEIDKDA